MRNVVHLRTAAEVAEIFQSTESWIKDKARRREVPFTMIAGQYRFSDQHIAEIVALFEQRPEDAHAPTAPRRRPTAKADDGAVTTLRARRPARKRSA